MFDFDRHLRNKWTTAKHSRKQSDMNDCCKNPANLKYDIANNNKSKVVVLKCRECKRRHFRAYNGTGRYNLSLK